MRKADPTPRPLLPPPAGTRRYRLYEIIFEADTPAGRAFDVALILAIAVSVVVVLADSVASLNARFGRVFWVAEWVLTALFTVEYVLRLYCVKRPLQYAASFFGLIDVLAIVPTFLSLLVPSGRYLLVIRVVRVLRIFRVLKLALYMGEANTLMRALRQSQHKIIVFFMAVLTLVILFGALMYMIEGEANGFTSIPQSIYWAIVTLTTVGYGDISPKTDLGRALASLVMVMGYSILAVPTGIVTVELQHLRAAQGRQCGRCKARQHDRDANYCRVCGEALPGEALP